jgi:thioredoxin-dependent peroxiredoxin
VRTQALFVKQQDLNFPLLSDPDASAAAKYDVLSKRGLADRVTFVVDPKGVLRHISDKVDVRAHGQDLVDLIKRLQAE